MRVKHTITSPNKSWKRGDELTAEDVEVLGENEVQRLIELGAVEGVLEPKELKGDQCDGNKGDQNKDGDKDGEKDELDIEELKAEALALGVQFHPQTGAKKLAAIIAKFKEANQGDGNKE